MRFIIDQIADDPYTDFAFEIWASQYPQQATAPRQPPDPRPSLAEPASTPVEKSA
jgi:hypothetical protein